MKNSTLVYLNIFQLIVIIVLSSLLYSRISQANALNQTVETHSEDVTSLAEQSITLKQELTRIREERERLGLANDSLDAQIAKLDDQIMILKSQNKINSSEMKKFRANLNNLTVVMNEKDQEILQLKRDNDSLTAEVDTLSKQTLALADSVTELAIEREHLKKDLAFASILKAEDVEISGLTEAGKEFRKQPFGHEKLSQIKMTFSIADNKAADHDKKKFLIRLITPNSECFSDPQNGGGTFVTHEGIKMKYTLSKNLLFENSNQWLSYVMPKGFNYVSGNYIVQIYCEGYDIGQGSFIVK